MTWQRYKTHYKKFVYKRTKENKDRNIERGFLFTKDLLNNLCTSRHNEKMLQLLCYYSIVVSQRMRGQQNSEQTSLTLKRTP